MKTVGYVRVSTDKQADQGVSLDAQAEKIRAMAIVHDRELLDIIVDGGESAKSLNRPGMAKLLAMVDAGKVQAVIVAKLDRLTRSVKADLCELLDRFDAAARVALVSVADSASILAQPPAAWCWNIMALISPMGSEKPSENARAMPSGTNAPTGSGWATWRTVTGSRRTVSTWSQTPANRTRSLRSDVCGTWRTTLRGICLGAEPPFAPDAARPPRGGWRSVARVVKQSRAGESALLLEERRVSMPS